MLQPEGMAQHSRIAPPVLVVEVRIQPAQSLENLRGLVHTVLTDAKFQHITCRPEHRYRGVVSLMCSIHRSDGLVGLFYPTLFSQFKNISYFHLVSVFWLLYILDYKDNKKD